MQSSYSVIKRDFAKSGDKKLIETEYVLKRPVVELEIDAEDETPQLPQIDPEEILKKYEDIGKRILEDAKREKQAITLKAQMEAELAEKKAYEKGYEQGLKNGHEDGYKEAYEKTIDLAKNEAKEIVNKAENLLRSANENYAIYLENKKIDVIKLSLEIASNIVRRELSYENSMNPLIEEAFRISKGEDNVIVKANSVHVKELETQVEKWKITYGIKNEIFVICDDSMEPGNAILEKPSGMVSVGVDIGMEQIKKSLLGDRKEI